jgi:hypothetical protein
MSRSPRLSGARRREATHWGVAWSVPAAVRALRATVVAPGLLALCFKVIGNPQMALYAAFGTFATLVMASFGGSRRDKAVAHLGLAVVGSVALTIGTLVSGTTWLAALVTVPIAFAILFGSSVTGRNAAAGVTAALIAYLLPVVNAGTASEIPARLAGWWLASAVGTATVLLVSPTSREGSLRSAAGASARVLASQLAAAARGEAIPAHPEAPVTAGHELMNRFEAIPYRPTGPAIVDQALAGVVHLLDWCNGLVSDAADEHVDLGHAARPDRELLAAAAGLLDEVAGLLVGTPGARVQPAIDRLERVRAASAGHQGELTGDPDQVRAVSAQAFYVQVIAVTARAIAADALIATGRADPATVAEQRREWYGAAPRPGRGFTWPAPLALLAGLTPMARLLARHASLRSVWFQGSARGAIALAAAVLVADLSGVHYRFFVVLGTLSVLRTSAAATGAAALRALAGTAVGFAAGAALLVGIGTGTTALWAALPLAVLIASYASGTAPFAVGQAAFTVSVLVLFNLLVPAGWTVGLLRIEDVAIGAAVSVVVGVLMWPRGVGAVVGDDLADAFRLGGAYLTQVVDRALGPRTEPRAEPPDAAAAAIGAGIRLDDALRGYLAEQGTKRVSEKDLWSLVMATVRLRFTAYSLAALPVVALTGDPGDPGQPDPIRAGLRQRAADLTTFYERIATQIGSSARTDAEPVAVPSPDEQAGAVPARPHLAWVYEHLHHLGSHAHAIPDPAARLAAQRHAPWWR